MRQVQYDSYGKPEVLKIREVSQPVIKSGELLVKVHYVGLNPKDAALRNGFLKQIRNKQFPKLTGFDFSGEVVQVGNRVTGYTPGDKVFGYFENLNGGAAADYTVVVPQQIAVATVDLKLAASMPCTYLTSLQAYQQVKLKQGHRVLIYGAAGGVGTAAMQLARHLGANVTAVSNSKNRSYCLENGANEFVGYDEQDPFSLSARFDLFFQVHVISGDKYTEAKKILKRGGKFVSTTPNPFRRMLNPLRKNKIYPIIVRANHADLTKLSSWASAGEIQPQVSEVFDLTSIKKAHELIHTQHTRGKIVLAID